jgi:lipopolysaccharide transport system ATP-binding protein
VPTSAIRIEGLSKRYRIGTKVHDHDRLTEAMWESMKRPFRRNEREEPVTDGVSSFWALEDVSLEVQQGDVLGVIGRNGAGKTTLLKILSRVTEPTRGTAELNGQVSALLEVGTGFHPELTGRENIFLNGGILGMSRAEIKSKFDEIVDFAEIERFIDTPVKRYSSGMFVRLAFAVAAHLEPEVLIIDEVLAVGDVNFQRKCLGKMEDVAQSGRTVLFVSHNTGAIAELCTRAILLEAGRKIADGPVAEVLNEYAHVMGSSGSQLAELEADPTLEATARAVEIRAPGGERNGSFDITEPIEIALRFEVHQRIHGYQLTLGLSRNGVRLIHAFDTDPVEATPVRDPGVYETVYRLPGMFLKAGLYTVDLGTGTPERHMQQFDGIASFEIEERSMNTHAKGYRGDRPGHLIGPGIWRTERLA